MADIEGVLIHGAQKVYSLSVLPTATNSKQIAKRNYHLFQPLLYQVATAALSPADMAWPIRSIFAAATPPSWTSAGSD